MRVLPFFADNEPGGLLFTVPCTPLQGIRPVKSRFQAE